LSHLKLPIFPLFQTTKMSDKLEPQFIRSQQVRLLYCKIVPGQVGFATVDPDCRGSGGEENVRTYMFSKVFISFMFITLEDEK
jgi:hypothetical protein